MKTFFLGVALLLGAVPGDEKTLGGVKPAAADTLMLYYPSDPNTINPLLSNDTASEDFLRWVVEPLAKRCVADPDKALALRTKTR